MATVRPQWLNASILPPVADSARGASLVTALLRAEPPTPDPPFPTRGISDMSHEGLLRLWSALESASPSWLNVRSRIIGRAHWHGSQVVAAVVEKLVAEQHPAEVGVPAPDVGAHAMVAQFPTDPGTDGAAAGGSPFANTLARAMMQMPFFCTAVKARMHLQTKGLSRGADTLPGGGECAVALAVSKRELAAAALVVEAQQDEADEAEQCPRALVAATYGLGAIRATKEFAPELLEVKHTGITVAFGALLAKVTALGAPSEVRMPACECAQDT